MRLADPHAQFQTAHIDSRVKLRHGIQHTVFHAQAVVAAVGEIAVVVQLGKRVHFGSDMVHACARIFVCHRPAVEQDSRVRGRVACAFCFEIPEPLVTVTLVQHDLLAVRSRHCEVQHERVIRVVKAFPMVFTGMDGDRVAVPDNRLAHIVLFARGVVVHLECDHLARGSIIDGFRVQRGEKIVFKVLIRQVHGGHTEFTVHKGCDFQHIPVRVVGFNGYAVNHDGGVQGTLTLISGIVKSRPM